jgi:hypothetical protein
LILIGRRKTEAFAVDFSPVLRPFPPAPLPSLSHNAPVLYSCLLLTVATPVALEEGKKKRCCRPAR